MDAGDDGLTHTFWLRRALAPGLTQPPGGAPSPIVSSAVTLVLIALLMGLAPSLDLLARGLGWSRRWRFVVLVAPIDAACCVIATAVAFGGRRALKALIAWAGWPSLWTGVVAWLAAGLADVMATGLVGLVVATSAVARSPVSDVSGTRPWPLVVAAVLLSGVAAPVSEELLFRGLVQRFLLSRAVPVPVAIVTSSVLFAMSHYFLVTHDPAMLAGYVGVGLVFGFLAWYSARLAPGIVGHTLLNLVVDARSLI